MATKSLTQNWYFISFRDPVKNRNLGCCNILVDDRKGSKSVLEMATELGVNPGGEAAIFQIDEPELDANRLYSREEMIALNYKKINQ
jgi:hypothetical protein